jgi:hypothetical protein
MHGQGKMVYSTGDEYQGQWQFHGRHGQGEILVIISAFFQFLFCPN